MRTTVVFSQATMVPFPLDQELLESDGLFGTGVK
jgi:hypothetical protein